MFILGAQPTRLLQCWNFVRTSNIIKQARSCRPRVLGCMISAEATREGGRCKLRSCFLKIHTVKSYQICNRVRASSAVSSVPWRIAEKIVVWCPRPWDWFSERCQNGQVESFRRAPIGSHWGAGWVFWVWSSSTLEPHSRCASKNWLPYYADEDVNQFLVGK